jgi:hypothetical protein
MDEDRKQDGLKSNRTLVRSFCFKNLVVGFQLFNSQLFKYAIILFLALPPVSETLFKIKERKSLLSQRAQRLIQRAQKIYSFVTFVLVFAFVFFVLNCILL